LLFWISLLAAPDLVDKVVAVVDTEIISLRELTAKASPFFSSIEADSEEEQQHKRVDILRRVLDVEIGERLVKREISGHKDQLSIGDAEVDRAIEQVQARHGLTSAQLQSELYGQGMTMSEYRAVLREQIQRAQLISLHVHAKVEVKAEAVMALCESRQHGGNRKVQTCVSHILFAPDARAEAARIHGEVAAGGDLAAYALKYSTDRSNPDGTLGCFVPGELVEALEQACSSLRVGEISGLVESPVGLHILRVDRRQLPPSGCSDEDVLARFREEVWNREVERQMQVWIEGLRKKAFVEVRL
jgi:parvulin-like peptidyl-prolyl isomerase